MECMDLLTTPGISTQIVLNLIECDQTIENLYHLVGKDVRTKQLQPFIDAIIEKKRKNKLRNVKRRNRRRIKKILFDLRAYINDIELSTTTGPRKKRRKIRLILNMFEYLCSVKNELSLLKNHLSPTTIMDTIDRLCTEARDMRNTFFETRALEYKQQLAFLCT